MRDVLSVVSGGKVNVFVSLTVNVRDTADSEEVVKQIWDLFAEDAME